MTEASDTPYDAVAALDLEPHPEGGWYRRTYTAADAIQTDAGERPAATLIHFWLRSGEQSAWHVVRSDEIWLWHGPGPLQLERGGTGDEPVSEGIVDTLGSPTTPGAVQQLLIPAGTWQRTLPGDENVLVSCLVTPGFDFADWRLARSAETERH